MKHLKNFFKYLWNDSVSMILLIIFIAFAIHYAGIDLAVTGLLGIAALFLVGQVNEKGRFIDFIIDKFKDRPTILQVLGLDVPDPSQRQRNWFEIIVLAIIGVATAFMLLYLIYTLIFEQ